MSSSPIAIDQPKETNLSTDARLEDWLKSNSLDAYIETFQNNNISYDLLGELTEEYFDKLGIYAVGDRIRLQKAISTLQPKMKIKTHTISVLSDKDSSSEVILEMNRKKEETPKKPKTPRLAVADNITGRRSPTTINKQPLVDDDPDYAYSYNDIDTRRNNQYDTFPDTFDLNHKYSSSVNESLFAHTLNGTNALRLKRSFSNDSTSHSATPSYNLSVNSQGDYNRMVAANIYVNDILEGSVEEEEGIKERQLIPRNWQQTTEMYARAHPEDAEDIHVICDLLKDSLVELDQDPCNESLEEIFDMVIGNYNRLKGFDTRITRDEMLKDSSLLIDNNFLIVNCSSASHLTNDVIFVRLNQRIILQDRDYKQLKFLFLVVGDEQHSIWCNNLYSLLKKIINDNTFYNDLFLAKDKEDVIQSLANIAIRIQKKPKNGKKKKKELFSGLKKDIRIRSKYYASDFSDGYTVNTILKTLIIFISQLGPALIFAVLINKYSHGNIGTVETILGEAITCILWAFFGGQPMILMGLTGPIAIFVGVLYDFSERIDLPFFVVYEWVGIWSSVLLFLIVIFNKAEIFSPVTAFTKHIFSSLTSVLFIVEVAKYIKKYYQYAKENAESVKDTLSSDTSEYNWEYFLFIIVVILLTVFCMEVLKDIRSTTFLIQKVRIFIRMGCQLITIFLVCSVVLSLFPTIHYKHMQIPSISDFKPSYSQRSWFIHPFRYETVLAVNNWSSDPDISNKTCPYSSDLLSSVTTCTFPWWAVFVTIIPAILYTIS